MWRTDGDHRTRSTGVMIELLDTEPDWERLVAAHDRFTQRVPRLRERVVEPPLPLVMPAWSPDPHFDLDYHLQRVRLPGDGSMAELHARRPSSPRARWIPSVPRGRPCLCSASPVGRPPTCSNRITV